MNDSDKTREHLIEELARLKTIEETLRQSEQRYKAIFETVREGILIMDVETKRFRYANPAVCTMFGYTPEEFTRFGVQDIHPKEQMDWILADFEANISGKKSSSKNIPCLRKDKTIFYVDINTANAIIDNRRCDIGCFTDVTRHKLDEDALRESEQKFRLLVEQLPAITYTAALDEASTTLYVSPQVQQILGVSPDNYKADPDLWRKMLHPDDISGVMKAVEATHKTGLPFSCEYRMIAKDGRVIWVRDEAGIIRDTEGKPLYLQGVMYDITTTKQAEADLRESEEKYRGLAERSFDMIFTTDTEGFNTYVSSASERIFGFKPEEIIGKHFTQFLAPTSKQKAIQHFREDVKGLKTPDIIQLEAVKKDGSHVFIELSPTPLIRDGISFGTQGIIRDVTERIKAQEQLQQAHIELESRVQQRTADLAGAVEKLQKEIAERKRAEESLRKAEERFRTIFENAVVGIYRTTPDGRILMANPALVKLMGYNSFDELSRLNLEKEGFDPSTPRSTFKQLIERDGFVSGLESIWLRRDGSRLYVLENAYAVRDTNGNILYYEGTAQDITKRKEAEEKLFLYQEQLRSLAAQLSLAEERLRRKIATNLHDNVSQNLAISKMKLEALAQSVNSDQANSLKEVIDLIAQTIEVSRSLTFEMSPPILYELGFIPALDWLANQTRQRFALETEFVDDGKPKPLLPDVSVLLFQAVRELLTNVVKHAKAHNVRIQTARVRGSIFVTVEDDGLGFDMAHVISARKRTAKKDASDYSPRGFGLFNIRERLNHIGGSIEIHSKSGRGTRVTLIAPLLKTRPKTKKKMK